MIILGILFLAAAAVAAVELILANDSQQVSFHMWRWTWHFDAFWLAVVGAAILFVGLLGLGMLNAGNRRARRLRRERREMTRENRQLAERADVAEAAPAASAESRVDGPTEDRPVQQTGENYPASGERPVQQTGENYPASADRPVQPTGQNYPSPGADGAPPNQYGVGQHQANDPVERRG